MPTLAIANRLFPMTDTGSLIRQRREALGMSKSRLADEARVDRGRLAALEDGDPSVTPRTIGAIEAALSRLETELGMDLPSQVGEGMVEFRVSGNFGVDVVVRGPVRDLDLLEKQVVNLIREMKSGPFLPDEDEPIR